MTVLELLTPPAVATSPELDASPLGGSNGPTDERRSLVYRFFRGREKDPVWVRPALLTLLTATAVLYLWNLGANGWANTFYSAAVQAGSQSWKAMLFGSSDSSNFITLDKTPAFLWPMEISARIFGLNSWSVLVPQALEGVATVGLIYLSVRRWFSAQAAILASAVVATTPVAAMMFRFNGPDAMLAFLLTSAGYAITRALERARTMWIILAGTFIGFAFITKMMMALLILPVVVGVYLLAAPTGWWRRVWQAVALGASVLVAAGWWVAAVALTPAADRPYIGGTQDNSVVSLIFGYNGLDRLGTQTVSVNGRSVSSTLLGPVSITRLFFADYGNMLSWLLPGALIMGGVLLALTVRAGRTDRERAAVLLWGGSLLVIGLAISLSPGIIHPYYTVAMVPSLGALVGISAAGLWRRRRWLAARVGLAGGLGATVAWSYNLLGRTPDWIPLLRPFVAVIGTLAVLGILALPLTRAAPKLAVSLVASVGLVAALAAPLLSTVATAATPQKALVPVVVPDGSGGLSGNLTTALRDLLADCGNVGTSSDLVGTLGGIRAARTFCADARLASISSEPSSVVIRSDSTLTKLLQVNASRYSWVAATVGSTNAAGYQLAAQDPVMSIGGFHQSDPVPTLAQFKDYVSEGRIHYFILATTRFGLSLGGDREKGDAAQITSWVESHWPHKSIGSVELYDLAPRHSS